MSNKLVSPFLKWVGGKRQIITLLENHLPKKISYYYEPFVGGGALLFHLQPKVAVINDYNEELINVYQTIKENADALLKDLKKHKNESDYFYQVRALDRDKKYQELSSIKKASRIIYLNKTCYNGLYRVNSAGEFNSPFGRYTNPNIVNEPVIKAVSTYLQLNDITILQGDYEAALKGIKKNAFVYFDPPYDPVSESANFTGYIEGGWNSDDQIRLKRVCDKLHAKGVKFLLSNSATSFIKELYKDYTITIIKANRHINSNAAKRGEVEEVLIKNYE